VGMLRGDGVPDFLKAVDQLEKPVGEIVHVTTSVRSVNRPVRQGEGLRPG
jgi:hypothetical protein